MQNMTPADWVIITVFITLGIAALCFVFWAASPKHAKKEEDWSWTSAPLKFVDNVTCTNHECQARIPSHASFCPRCGKPRQYPVKDVTTFTNNGWDFTKGI